MIIYLLGYNIVTEVIKLNETSGNEEKEDFVKTVNVTVKYNLQGKEKEINMKKIKARENISLPNAPVLEEGMLPVIYVNNQENGYWKVTNNSDIDWYNYDNGIWATAVYEDETEYDKDSNKILNNPDFYIWVPKYSYNTSNKKDISFIYSYTEKTIKDNKLVDIDEGQSILSDFNEDKKGVWLMKNTQTQNSNVFKIFNDSNYKCKNY